MINGKTTVLLENTIATFSEGDKAHRKDIIIQVLHNTLQRYQWYYQVSDKKKAYRDLRTRYKSHIQTTVELLRTIGQETLSNDVKDALYNDDQSSVYTQKKVLSQAKQYMKEQFIEAKMKESTYNKDLAVLMDLIFRDWCEKHPLETAPYHLDNSFDPSVFL